MPPRLDVAEGVSGLKVLEPADNGRAEGLQKHAGAADKRRRTPSTVEGERALMRDSSVSREEEHLLLHVGRERRRREDGNVEERPEMQDRLAQACSSQLDSQLASHCHSPEFACR